MLYLRFLFFFSAVLCTFSSIAQQTYLHTEIQLDTLENFHDGLRNIGLPEAVQVWGSSNSMPDSILWKFVLQKEYSLMKDFNGKTDSVLLATTINQYHIDTSGMNCPDLPEALYILARRQHHTLTISLLRRYNRLLDLDKEIILSYPIDSLEKWTLRSVPGSAIPRITINYPYCVDNKVIIAPWEFYLIPVKDKNISFNDNRLNEMPLFISHGKTRVAEFANARLYFFKQKYSSPDSTDVSIKIRENGAFHRDKIINNLRYKDQYKITDTLVVGSKLYKIDMISHDWQYAYIRPLKSGVQKIQLSPASLKTVTPYFKNSSNELIIDFWGTWCNPCIEKLPALKALNKKARQKFNFLSICVDKPENISKAKDIFSSNKIEWSQLFVDMGHLANTIVAELEVSCYPSYIIINRKGEIIFSGCGTDGFNTLQEFTLKD